MAVSYNVWRARMPGFRVGVAAAVISMIGAASALACQGSSVLFEDNLDDMQPTWGTPDAEQDVKDHKLLMMPKMNYTNWLPNTAGLYDNVDFCADATTVKAVDPADSFGGLIFWYIDDQNFYAFEYDANGSATVQRRQRGKWLKQIDWQKVPDLKTGDGATNSFRVVTIGNEASFFINGKAFKKIKGVPPEDGQEIGFIASSPKNAVSTYAYSNIKVTEPDVPKK